MTPRKKILFVITKSNWGGAQRYVYDLATNLPKDLFDVEVAFGQEGLLAKRLREAGVKTYELKSLQRDVAFGADTKSFFELLKLFKSVRPDIVHLNSSKVGGLGALAARCAWVPKIVFTAHGWPFREQRTIIQREMLWLMSWFTALLSTKTICVSDYDLRQACKMPFIARKALRIYNGIDPQIVFGSGDTIRNNFPTGAKIIGTVGELNKNKNHIALINEAKSNREMFVAIVGEGEERGTLEKEIQTYALGERVKLFGFMPAQEAMKGFDVFALPSIKEGLPYVLLEAKAAGLPISANRVGGVGEILDSTNPEDFTLATMLAQTQKVYLA